MNNVYIVDDCKTPVTKSEMMPTASCDWEQVANSTLQHLLPIKSGMKKRVGEHTSGSRTTSRLLPASLLME